MQTIATAQKILTDRPGEAMRDAVGLAAMVALIFAGFLVPALF